jgi:transposase
MRAATWLYRMRPTKTAFREQSESGEIGLGSEVSPMARSMSYSRVEILDRPERRRRFSADEKRAILAEASEPGANVSEVARRHGLFPTQVYKWRRLCELGVIGVPVTPELPSFVAVHVAGSSVAASIPAQEAPVIERGAAVTAPSDRRHGAGLIEIDVGGGRRIRVDAQVDAAALAVVLDALDRRPGRAKLVQR